MQAAAEGRSCREKTRGRKEWMIIPQSKAGETLSPATDHFLKPQAAEQSPLKGASCPLSFLSKVRAKLQLKLNKKLIQAKAAK